MKRIFTAMLSLVTLATLSIAVRAQSASREDVLKDIAAKRAELQQLEDQFLSPAEEDRVLYKEFLSQPDSGLIRLLPREVYESDTYNKNKKTMTIRGGGSYYSFALRSHEYGEGTDIGLEQGNILAGFAGFNFGIMTNLGDVPLDEITVEDPRARFVSNYGAPATESEVRSEQMRFGRGVTIGEAEYNRRFPVQVDATYLVRSIDYYAKENVLVAFRIVRKDTDGSIIIAWKILRKYSTPEVARNK